MWKCDFKRTAGSVNFCGALLIMILGAVTGTWELVGSIAASQYINENAGLFILCYSILHSNGFLLAMLLACVLPAGALFLEDYQNRCHLFFLLRTKRKIYCSSKLVITYLTGAMAAGAGFLLGLLCNLVLLAFKGVDLPLFLNNHTGEWAQLAAGLFCTILGGACWAVIGGVCAALIKNVYMAYAVPFVTYYILDTFQRRYYKKLEILNPKEWMTLEHIPVQAGIASVLCVSAIALVCYRIIMEKRLRDG